MAGGTAATVAAIEAELAGFGGSGGVYAKRLETGEEIRVNADVETATASTIKVPILIELFRQVEVGAVDLESRLPVTPAVRTVGSGVLRELSDGVELSVRDHATLMIVVSDNVSTNALIDLIGLERVNRTMAAFGFPRTRLKQRLDFPKIGADARNFAVSTPAELAGIMEALAMGRILGEASRAAILEIMRRQHYLGLVPRYLPYSPYGEEMGEPDNGLRIANKTGGWRGMRADMALVEWPGTRYAIAVVTEGDADTRFWPENAGDRLIGRISRLVFDHFGGAALATAPRSAEQEQLAAGG
ncbi:MAG: class A beta-lactamase-related serine hydrolase [Chloroflexota bacterium]|nr:class A beta-lactamase-related serine hydrolase [Chloroflexota bacterium]